MKLKIILALLPAILGAWIGTAWSQSPVALKSDSPINIDSDRFEADHRSKNLVFTGNVRATQDEFKINCDTLTAIYKENAKGEKESYSIDRLVAQGRVVIIQKDIVAKSERAEYFNQGQKVILTGSPEVKQDKNTVNGQKITLLLPENKYLVEGKVKTVIFPQKSGQR
ncbi:MAG: lipopolysaccharide transport periplasmic protein LptA [Deltaproteobacteria bacterium]|nr:lipopolysaccharide transport periplasmic protein LptA [Deltaproteobacteria bacterium]